MKSGKNAQSSQTLARSNSVMQVPNGPARGREHQVQPLTREFFNELIRLETKISNKDYTLETLDELTQFYANAVEYYDGIKDNIAHYFLYKIQDTLATKKSLRILMDEASKANNKQASPSQDENGDDLPRERSKTEMIPNSGFKKRKGTEDSFGSDDDIEDSELERQRQEYLAQRGKGGRDSITQIRIKKARFATYFVKVEQHKHMEKQNLLSVINEYDSASKQNDKLIKTELDEQKSRLKKRLEQKRMNSFMHSTSQFSTSLWLDELNDAADDNKSTKSALDPEFLKSPKEINFNTPSTKQESESKPSLVQTQPFTKEAEASFSFSPIALKPNIADSAESLKEENTEKTNIDTNIKVFDVIIENNSNNNEPKEGQIKDEQPLESDDSELKLESGKDIVIENGDDRVESVSFDSAEENSAKNKNEEGNQQTEDPVLVHAEV